MHHTCISNGGAALIGQKPLEQQFTRVIKKVEVDEGNGICNENGFGNECVDSTEAYHQIDCSLGVTSGVKETAV